MSGQPEKSLRACTGTRESATDAHGSIRMGTQNPCFIRAHPWLKTLPVHPLRNRRWRAKGPHPSQPGATPQENPMKMGVRAESPIHRWRGRAGNGPGFQPSRISFRYSWGVAPGWDGLRLWRTGHRTCIAPAFQGQPHRHREIPTPTQTPCRTQWQATHRQTTRRRREGGDRKDER